MGDIMTKKKNVVDKPIYQEYINGNDGLHYDEQLPIVGDKNMDAIKYIEKEYPQTAKSFKAVQKEQYELFCKKQMDYGPKNISVGTDLRTDEDVKLSLTGLWFRINDKIERLKQLVVLDKAAQNEPMIDAFSDLSVYGIIAQIVHRKKWGK